MNTLKSNPVTTTLYSVLIAITSTIAFLPYTSEASEKPVVKMSSSNICHDKSSSYYARTKRFIAYNSIEECINNGGRPPKGYTYTPSTQGNNNPNTETFTSNSDNQSIPKYSRNSFAGWLDEDGDCLNTRHELLLELSTAPTKKDSNGCRVMRGRWVDPYSGSVFLDSTKMDIDHLVPLKWAWENGAYAWNKETRDKFSNDPVNLFAVSASLNRSKGAKGPDEWMPPNKAFHCQYVTRFHRVIISYPFPENTRNKTKKIMSTHCKNQ